MSLKDALYINRKQIGLKKNVTFDEIMELEKLINDYKSVNIKNDIIKKDLKILLNTSLEMKKLLEECRNHKLPIKLAEKIDNTLKNIENM